MSLKKILRIAIVVEWASVLFSVLASGILESHLPPQLQDYLLWEAEQEITTLEYWLLIPVIIIILMYLISSIGLFLYKPWAKRAYIITGIVGFVILPFTGPIVDHALAYTIADLRSVAFGFILALLLFTNVYENEKNNAEQSKYTRTAKSDVRSFTQKENPREKEKLFILGLFAVITFFIAFYITSELNLGTVGSLIRYGSVIVVLIIGDRIYLRKD